MSERELDIGLREKLFLSASHHLDTPLSTVQVALKDLRRLSRIVFRDRERVGKGRPEKMYSFRRAVQPSRNTSL